MPDMLNQLHDEIDDLEGLRERATTIGKNAKAQVSRALEVVSEEGFPDIPAAMELLAAAIEEELAPLTTDAFNQGVKFSRDRREAKRRG